LTRTSIVIDEGGVSASAFGMRLKSTQWGEVKRIRKTRSPGYSGHCTVSFQIEDENTHPAVCRFFVNVCGNVAFTQEIRGLRDLLDQINFYAREYKISLVVWDIQAAGAKLAPLKGSAYWRQATARIPEIEVEGF
jgi:hypothetical protein